MLVAIMVAAGHSVTFSQIPIGFGNNKEFTQLTVNNGLSQNSVTSIVQDKNGFIWVGSYDGLNRFDGLQVKNYRHQSNSPFSLADNRILALCALNNGNLLIGSEGGGLSLYHQQQEQFLAVTLKNNQQQEVKNIVSICKTRNENILAAEKTQIYYIEKLTDKTPKNITIGFAQKGNILRLYADEENNVWIGTDNGLYLLKYPIQANAIPVKVADGHFSSLFEDKDKNLWYGGYGNLGIIKKHGERLITLPSLYTNIRNSIFAKNHNMLVSAIAQDNAGNIYLSTDQYGLLVCALNSRGEFEVKEHFYSESRYSPLPENNINTCFIDSTNTLWLGTFQNGVAYNSLNPKNIYSFLPLIGAKRGKYITTVSYHQGNIWIGTMDNGLWRYDTGNGKYINETGVVSRSILCFFYDAPNNRYYVGGNQGLYRLDKGKSWQKILDNTVRSICTDKFGRLWLATWQGIIIYTPATGATLALTEKDGLSSNMGYVLLPEKNGQIVWCGTIGGGLNKINYTANGIAGIKKYVYRENQKGISNNHIWCLFEDKKGNIWVGTDAGLNFVNAQQISQLKLPEIENSKITSITEDSDGAFWIGTGNGLAHYKPRNNRIKFYRHNDGLLSNTLTEATFKMPNGSILVGTINGLNAFYSKAIQTDQYLAKVAFTSLSVYGQTVNSGDTLSGRVLLKQSINTVGKLNLKHNENNLSLSVAALHFAAPKANRIRYKLEGYDKDWIVAQAGLAAITYSHLPTGEYQLRVSAANNDGLWSNEVKTLAINISPSPWLSWWAKTIYLLILAIIGWLIYRNYMSRKNMQQQVFLEKYEKEKMAELNELKLDFFTKITHDLRTPLSLIIGPTTDIAENVLNQSSYLTDRINIIRKNATRLLTLINQILDFRKIAEGSIVLNLKQDSLEDIVMETKNAFVLLAETRHISFTAFVEKKETVTWIDREKMEKVLYNLVSNAFSHTDDGGKITIKATFEQKGQQLWTNITVEDNGKGIKTDELEHIFEMYYQGKTPNSKGSGIGLTVVKKLTELQNGKISVESTYGKGTVFTLSIPLGTPEGNTTTNVYIASSGAVDLPTSVPAKDSILILEDEPDLLNYLADTLSNYHIIKAETAEMAFALAKKQQPHLIISDLMLPDMDGHSFLKLIKHDIKTAHIPVIMHTVKYDRDTIKQLMESGADDFIPKPTNYGDLKRKVGNILATRKKLIENLHNQHHIDPHFADMPSANEDFLAKMIKCVEQNLTNPDFSVEKLSSEMAMSRMNLHRKLDSMLGKTASELIREIRMKKAGQLLASGHYRISEVMFEVGISSNHYFNKYFKEMYGISAKEFIAKQKSGS